ncbi:hypothetical protein ACOME3_006272 [Neoechinorhynchus agilis]
MASPNSSGVGYGIDKWVTDTTLNFKNNILNVKNNLMRANALVIEGNYLAQQLNANCKYAIELKIPKENIRPHFNEDPMISEVIITATLKNEKWPSFEMSVDDFETYLEKMRDFYTKRLKKDALNHDTNDLYRMFRDLTKRPTNVDERLHCLIGVAFVILKPALEQVITFTYPSPIFNRQGEIVGRLNVCLRRLVDNKCSPESSLSVQVTFYKIAFKFIEFQIRIRDATDLPFHLTNNVFCQYTFFDEAEPTIVKSQHQSSSERAIRFSNKSMIMFNHKNIFRLLDKEKIARFNRLAENGGVFSLQVYGHAMNSPQTKSRTPSNSFDEDDFSDHKLLTALAEKWTSMSCHLTMWLEIQELNEAGIWVAVPLSGYNLKSLSCGGFFKIRQGQSHRIVVRVSCTKDRYSYPIKVNNILSVEAGAIRCSRLSTYGSKLDSYHDKHLELLKTEWLAALGHRRFHLESQLKRLNRRYSN